ncbi:MAG TPA: hypothetical protein PLH15_03825 [Spirochaetota bacterium]|jgi:hypothetical protein|nr:hypothetical protein [Spirochaetota bacterium]HQO21877.1 hypothetical protein [Spirochaetota bacterium]HQQ22946.1 hypothetical protein [Spirochaetota bacterium]
MAKNIIEKYKSESDIEVITNKIEKAMHDFVKDVIKEKFRITHYGANYIHPRYLSYWICVLSDKERDRLVKDSDLMKKLRKILEENNYPISGRNRVYIGFESQETVDRESNGNWFLHWK